MFDIGSVFGSIAKAVLPSAIEAVGSGATLGHRQHEAALSSGPPSTAADPMARFVANHGLHSVATAELHVTKVVDR